MLQTLNKRKSFQLNLIFTVAVKSDTFDVTLMMTLLRNLTELPDSASGYDRLPSSTDVTIMADLARIKHYRNQLAHFTDGKINSVLFKTAWDDISGVNTCFCYQASSLKHFRLYIYSSTSKVKSDLLQR